MLDRIFNHWLQQHTGYKRLTSLVSHLDVSFQPVAKPDSFYIKIELTGF